MWNDWVVIVRFRVVQDTGGGLDKIRDRDLNSPLFLSTHVQPLFSENAGSGRASQD